MIKDQLIARRIYWPKVAMFGFAITLPLIAVGYSNKHVFSSAFPIATIILIMVWGVSLITTYFSGNAARRTRRYAILLDIGIAMALCVNLLMHFQLAREVSTAEDARVAYREEDEREEQRKDREVQRAKEMSVIHERAAEAQTKLMSETRKALVHTPINKRGQILDKLPNAITQEGAAQPESFSSTSSTSSSARKTMPAYKTPEEIRGEWFDYLFWASAIEIFLAVLGGMILMATWQWDVDGDGRPDDVNQSGSGGGFTPMPTASQYSTFQTGFASAAPRVGNTTFTTAMPQSDPNSSPHQ